MPRTRARYAARARGAARLILFYGVCRRLKEDKSAPKRRTPCHLRKSALECFYLTMRAARCARKSTSAAAAASRYATAARAARRVPDDIYDAGHAERKERASAARARYEKIIMRARVCARAITARYLMFLRARTIYARTRWRRERERYAARAKERKTYETNLAHALYAAARRKSLKESDDDDDARLYARRYALRKRQRLR